MSVVEEARVESRDIEDVARAMLTENTGAYLTDSGGAYGRNWERNQGCDFEKEPKVDLRFSAWDEKLEICATISLYHWMVGNLEFDAEMQARFDAYIETQPENTPWLALAEEFGDLEQERMNDEWGASQGEARTVNTYNESDHWDLSQTLQFIALQAEGSCDATHVILQVHGGCDVRGGYTAPKCFRLRSEEYQWLEAAKVNEIWVGDWYWSYDGFWDGRPNRTPHDSDRERCPPSLPDDILKTPAFMEDAVPENVLDYWHIVVASDRKSAHLHAPRGYTSETYDVGPWEMGAGNLYL